jgi:hypothetical protein
VLSIYDALSQLHIFRFAGAELGKANC